MITFDQRLAAIDSSLETLNDQCEKLSVDECEGQIRTLTDEFQVVNLECGNSGETITASHLMIMQRIMNKIATLNEQTSARSPIGQANKKIKEIMNIKV